ncbi:MAG: low temperature requirement protein A [Solirubrobacterales bacterium]|nr:low temperature requirement protein A [Solirubrobacterales bacterium]
MSAADQSERRGGGVSTLELFFDLVFVFTITQLTGVLVEEPSWEGLFQVSVMLGVIFWMYGGYVWLTNTVIVDRLARRLTLLGGMAGFLVVALSVPEAFDGSGAAFGAAYLAVVLIHLGMFVRSSHVTVAQAMVGLAPFNLGTALLIVVGGLLGGTAQYAIWATAFMLEWISPKLIDDSGFVIEPGHFVERHGLVVIIAIGESIIAVGIGAAGLPIDVGLVTAAVLGLGLSACLWWSHFGADEGVPEQRMAAAPMAARPRLAIHAFGYWHMLILLGVVAAASALKETTAHPFDPLPEAQALALGGGVAVFLLGEALFRATLSMPSIASRGLTALLALASVPIGLELSAAAQLTLLIVLLVAMLGLEYSRPTRRSAGRTATARPASASPGACIESGCSSGSSPTSLATRATRVRPRSSVARGPPPNSSP